jgi:hypothetical protein
MSNTKQKIYVHVTFEASAAVVEAVALLGC